MIEVRELGDDEITDVLESVSYGHLACSDDGKPYVVPIHYAYDSPYIYIYTTEGKKSEIIAQNPYVCLQVEKVIDDANWQSVIVNGEAEELTDETEKSNALDAILRVNPTLTPAVSIHWMDNWVRENIEVLYRITPLEMTGRMSIPNSESGSAFVPPRKSDGSIL